MAITVKVFDRVEDLDYSAALWMAERMKGPAPVIGLATGSTPIAMYRHMVQLHQQGQLDFSHVRSFNLDEYVGLSKDHEQSYAAYMDHHLFNWVNIDRAKIHIPQGDAPDPYAEAQRYDELIKTHGPVDAQVLGIGQNGHIGFNEPGTPFDSRTHVVTLDESTRKANAGPFGSVDAVPTQAITLGIQNILEAKEILLIAKGASKADAVRRALKDDPTVDLPASVLQKHPRVTFFLDQAAASGL